jgi:hypothetical protein
MRSLGRLSREPSRADFIVPECPDVPMWSEKLLFAVWDSDPDVAMWLHLGTVPGKWTMWEDSSSTVAWSPRCEAHESSSDEGPREARG